MILKTERLIIRAASDDEMRELIVNEKDEGLKQAYTEMLDMAIKYPESREWFAMWLIEDADGKRIGELCFKGLSADGAAEIGYGIEPEFQNSGYATEAVKAVTAWALSQPGVCCITAETDESNIASQRVLIKTGFIAAGKYGEEGPIFALYKEKSESGYKL